VSEPLATLDVERLAGPIVVARLTGEIDLSNAEELERSILAETRGAPTVVLDLSQVGYIDSAGVVLLQRVAQALVGEARSLRLAAPRETPAARIVSLSALDAAIPVHPSCEEALAGSTAPEGG
jgi:anti-sigma B factor antagonist